MPVGSATSGLLFVNGFHRSGTTLMSAAVTEAVGGVTTTVGVLARHIPAVATFLSTDSGKTPDRGADQLPVTPETAEEYGFLLGHYMGTRALYGHPDGVRLLRGHITELAGQAPGAPVVLKNPWETGCEARLLADFPDARIIILRRRVADIERSVAKALVRTSSSAYARALEWDEEGHQRFLSQIQSRRRRALLLLAYRWALRRRVYRLTSSVRQLPLDRIALLSYDELRDDPETAAAWAAHLVDPRRLAEAFTRLAFPDRGARTGSSVVQRALDWRWKRSWDAFHRRQLRAGLLPHPVGLADAQRRNVRPVRATLAFVLRSAPLKRAVAAAIRLGLLAHSSPRTRRMIPAAAAFRLAEPYSAWARRSREPRWDGFRRFQEQLLEHTPLARAAEEIAERQSAEMFRTVEMYWRPWLVKRGEVDGLEHVRRAYSEGRGVVAVFPHFGMFYAQYTILPRLGVDACAVVGALHFQDLGNGYGARFVRQGRAYIDQLGAGHVIPAGGGAFEPALEALRNGATVSVAFDLAGSTPTPFLGRTVSLASGASRLAYNAEGLVVPFVTRRDGHVPVLRFAPPIDSRDYDDALALQVAIAGVMERWVLELPEAVWPLRHNGMPLIQGPALEMAPEPA